MEIELQAPEFISGGRVDKVNLTVHAQCMQGIMPEDAAEYEGCLQGYYEMPTESSTAAQHWAAGLNGLFRHGVCTGGSPKYSLLCVLERVRTGGRVGG